MKKSKPVQNLSFTKLFKRNKVSLYDLTQFESKTTCNYFNYIKCSKDRNYINKFLNYNLTSNILVVVALALTSFHICSVDARRISSQTFDGNIFEIVLGDNLRSNKQVPLLSDVHIICNFDYPIWFRNNEKLNVSKFLKILNFDSITKTDAAVYSCHSEASGSWSNLTLSVIPPEEIGENYIDEMQAYSLITAHSDVIDADFNSDVQHDYPDQDKNGDMDQDDTRDDNQTVLRLSDENAPFFKNSQKLFKLLSKPSGSFIQLPCPANGNPMPNITWTKDGSKISRTMGKVTYKKWAINMEDLIPEDSGVYTCKICNVHGCIEHSANLIINDRLRSRPILSEGFPQNQTALENSTVQFECKVISDLEPHIIWVTYLKHNETIESLERLVPNLSNLSNLSNSVSRNFTSEYPMFRKLKTDPEKTNVLKLENVTQEDEGWYTCIAANSLGQSTSSAYLQVIGEIPEIEAPVSLLIRSQPMWISVVAVVVILLFLVGTTFIIYVLRKLKHEKLLKHRIETVHQWTKRVIIYKPTADPSSPETMVMPIIKIEKQRTTLLQSSNTDPAPFNEYEFPLDSNWEIPRNQLVLGVTLGEGAFGRVVMAEANGLNKCPSASIVAVKMVKEGHTDADMASLVREMEVMKMIGKHINIINLLGCCSQDGPLFVIVEYAPHGNLKDFLKKNRHTLTFEHERYSNACEREILTEKNLISFAFQVARGMEYLASRRCIHRDLAARNVLVSDDYVIKIADFGLARDIQDTDYYRKNTNGRLPIKWMAPESLQEKFYDTQSDVWSYGVLLWEIMTYGEQPYPQIMSAEELYSYLMSGQRMEKPQRCSLNIYMLMRQCWHFDANARPTFTEIVENLDTVLLAKVNAHEEYLDLALPFLETPPSSSDDESDTETLRETSLYRFHYK